MGSALGVPGPDSIVGVAGNGESAWARGVGV